MFDIEEFLTLLKDGDVQLLQERLVALAEDSDGDGLTSPIFDGLPLLNYCCTNEEIKPDVVRTLILNGCDVNLSSKEGRPLQIVAKNGNHQLVDVLLDNGAILETDEDPIFSENSPFYLASLYGQTEVVRRLLSYQPKMVKDDGIRSCLLFAACRGGTVEIVKLWMSPSMDINQPKLFVSSLEDCENGTPLYAACAGHHFEVAKFLYEMGALFTEKICRDFPEIVGEVLENYNYVYFRNEDQCEEEEEAGHIAKYRDLGLGGFHFDWVSSYTETLVDLDLSCNSISALPTAIPWGLHSLLRLNVGKNKLVRLSGPDGPIHCHCLTEIQLANNKLEDVCQEVFQLENLVTLNLSNNNLKYLLRTAHIKLPVVTKSDKDDAINCPKLSSLNVSHNKLELLPQECLRKCSGLSYLDVSHNNLVSFPNAWDCNMMTLNLSYNELDRCPVSLEQYWCGTLRTLHIENNKLEDINESVVKLGCLVELYAAHNNICRLPHPDLWECLQLILLDLSHNCLGPRPSNKRISSVLKSREDKQIEENTGLFPSFLGNCLQDLNLSHNGLHQIPLSVCSLGSLHHLDISHNPSIKTLPKELGNLKYNCRIKMEGVNITDIKKLVEADCVDEQQRSKQIITNLRNDLRQCEKYYKMKLVILGKKDKGKTTLAGLLKGQTLSSHHLLGVQRHDIELSPKGGSFIRFLKKDNPAIKFSLWDLSGDPTISATHHCFYTPNSLYMLVWDLWSIEKELDKIGQYLYSIQARMPNASILLVATFLDRNTLPTKQQDVACIKQCLLERYGPEGDQAVGLSTRLDSDSIVAVSCTTLEGIQEMKDKLYDLATRMPDPDNRPHPLLGRKVPKSYINLEAALHDRLKTIEAEQRQPFIHYQDFVDIISKIPNNDIESLEEIQKVTKFLSANGTILHFNDQLKGLNNLYFLDPRWLCDVLSLVLLHVAQDNNIRGGKISKSEVRQIFQDDPRFPDDYIDQYIQLMERFEIALSIDFGGKLFIPSQLSKYPAIQLNRSEREGVKVVRLYKMAFIPSGFWSRLLSRLMYRIELLTSDWILSKSLTSSFTPAKFQKMLERQSSSAGLRIDKHDMIYWEDGLYLGHESGCLVVESTIVPQGTGAPSHSGVLITVQSTKGDYSIMGIVVDEIDDLLNDHYPGLMDWDEYGQPRVQRYALCPVCFESNRTLPKGLDHFSVEHCARLVMSSETITCPKNSRVDLILLVPELLMHEIPKKFVIDITKLTVKEQVLGIGVAGKVLKGRYNDMDVAVKLYHGAPSSASFQLSSMDSSYHTGGDQVEERSPRDEQEELYKNYSAYNIDADETNSLKAWKAFMEMRQEVLVTSKLHHPYIVSFLGISVRPSLLMCLEYAPCGNLRTFIDKAIGARDPFNKYRDKGRIFQAVFQKQMSYKIIYQIASGLSYLHKHGIIYRDLKSDNILVFSENVDSSVIVKLSDYGISKFTSSGGIIGLVGTPGYQAPEIISGLAYDEKVDIFSFSMVIYEVLSGRRPFEEYRNLAQISTAIKTQSKRPQLQDYNVDPVFPCLEQLMKTCWDTSADKRPSADDITSEMWMRSVQFLAFKKTFTLPYSIRDSSIDCVSFTTDSRKTETIWLWEGAEEGRKFTTLDRYTVNDDKGCVPRGESLPGSKVTCMCQVDKDIWIGTEGFKIETYSPQCFVKKEKKPLCTFNTPYAVPTSIIFIKEDIQEEKRVYAALDTGKVIVFEPVNRTIYLRTLKHNVTTSEAFCGWRQLKTLTIGKRAAMCMCYIPPTEQCRNEIWVGCGENICIISDSTCMVEGELEVVSLVKNLKLQPDRMVRALLYWNDRVWCLINNSTTVIEFDVDLRRPTYIFDMNDLNPLGLIVSEYISGMNLAESTESIMTTFFRTFDKNDEEDSEKVQDQTKQVDDSEDMFHDNDYDLVTEDTTRALVSNVPPPIPSRRPTKPRSDGPPCVPERSTNAPPTIPPRSPKIPPGHRSSSCSQIPEDRPEILYNRVSHSVSDDSFPGDDVKVCSIAQVGDTLWVGRNLGDILVVNVGQGNSYDYGSVIGLFKVTSSAHMGNDVNVLLSTGHSVISWSKSGDSRKGEVIMWEPYSSSDIKQIKEYWSSRRSGKMSAMEMNEVRDMGQF